MACHLHYLGYGRRNCLSLNACAPLMLGGRVVRGPNLRESSTKTGSYHDVRR
jgi:hypothetical protein